MDRDKFSCMQSQQSSTSNHGCYNESTRADYLIWGSRPYHPLPSKVISQTTNRPLLTRKDFWGKTFWSFLSAKPKTDTLANYSCNSCNLRIIVDSSPPPRRFSRLRIFTKKSCVPLLFVLCIILSHMHPSNFACGEDRPSNRSWRKISTTVGNTQNDDSSSDDDIIFISRINIGIWQFNIQFNYFPYLCIRILKINMRKKKHDVGTKFSILTKI